MNSFIAYRRSAFLFVAALTFAGGAARAGVLPGVDGQLATATPAITLAAEGCGIGEHRGPLGHCRPNEAPRVCPRGFHLGPQGRDCIRN